MPFIGNGIKSKETGKSGVKTEFTSLFITFHKMVYKIGSGKGSLSTGPFFHSPHVTVAQRSSTLRRFVPVPCGIVYLWRKTPLGPKYRILAAGKVSFL